MKELIDYFNEKYTKKKEYICKDLKPIKLLNYDEYMDFGDDASLIRPQEIYYYPLFKVPKIKNNRPTFIGYILKTDDEEYKGVMEQYKDNGYWNDSVEIVINGDEIVLETYDISINKNNCSLTLYINSPELPKIEYPKNKMDMYRACSFILTVVNYIGDDNLWDYIDKIILPLPKNIDEADLYHELIPIPISISKDSYFLTKKDNYYTALDAIKRGKSIYYEERIYPYWTINTEEKSIMFQNLNDGINITLFENGLSGPPK